MKASEVVIKTLTDAGYTCVSLWVQKNHRYRRLEDTARWGSVAKNEYSALVEFYCYGTMTDAARRGFTIEPTLLMRGAGDKENVFEIFVREAPVVQGEGVK